MFAHGKPNLNYRDILKIVPEEYILALYLGIKTLPCIINSPFRVDKNPSFFIYLNRNNKIAYIDFGTKEHGDLLNLLMRLWGSNYIDSLDKIILDCITNRYEYTSEGIKSKKSYLNKIKSKNKIIDLQCKVREWGTHDIEYWESYGISLKWLKFGNIYPISHVIYVTKDNTYIMAADRYAYVYVEFKEHKPSIKIYQPYNKQFKWRNNHSDGVWDLWEQLPPKGEYLIITSSRKDALCIWENTGIPAVALQGEGYIPKDHVVKELKDRFKHIFILFDNDFSSEKNYGRIFGNSLSNRLNIPQIEIPVEYKSKDISDLAYNYGRMKVKEVINKLIKL